MNKFDYFCKGFSRISFSQKHKHIDPSGGFKKDAVSLKKDWGKVIKGKEKNGA